MGYDKRDRPLKRGIRTKLEKGWRSGKAPLGYRNDPSTRTIVADPERFPLIREMFDLLLSGKTPKQIWDVARNDWGLRTPKRKQMGGRPIALSMVYRILNNPFYAGFFEWQGRTYRGGPHRSLLTMGEYKRAKTILGRPEKPRPHHRQFAFTGLIRCGECGLLADTTPTTTAPRRRADYLCRQPSVTVEELEA